MDVKNVCSRDYSIDYEKHKSNNITKSKNTANRQKTDRRQKTEDRQVLR